MLPISPAFTPAESLVGGVLIGAICAARLAARGKLSGLSTDSLFVPGLVAGGFALALLGAPTERYADGVVARLALGGVLVGTGVRLGEGCTSGNGVQGLSCLSLAALVNVLSFMGAAAAVASATGASAALGLAATSASGAGGGGWWRAGAAAFGAALQAPLADRDAARAADLVAGLAFACALSLGGMSLPSKVVGFLEPARTGGWDPSLACVMGGALLFALPAVQLGGLARAGRAPHVAAWAARPVRARTVVGGLLFGAGWGLTGQCPCPALAAAGDARTPLRLVFAAAMIGSHGAAKLLMPQAAPTSKAA